MEEIDSSESEVSGGPSRIVPRRNRKIGFEVTGTRGENERTHIYVPNILIFYFIQSVQYEYELIYSNVVITCQKKSLSRGTSC